MLQRTPTSLVYLSAEELKITARERAGLIEVRDDLASGRVKHAPGAGSGRGFHQVHSKDVHFFNMMYIATEMDCGTACCILGFMKVRDVYPEYHDFSGSLRPLFAPFNRDALTPAQAVRAIDHFLSGAGPECWAMALADIPL